MDITYGFTSTMTARPGRGDDVVDLLLRGLAPGNPASDDSCRLYLVSRSASDPDVVSVQEGWTSEQDHQRLFRSPAAQALVAGFADLLATEPVYTDLVPVSGTVR